MSRIRRLSRTPRVFTVGIAVLLVTFSIGLVASSAAAPAPSFARLHLGSDGRFFQYGTTTQNLTTQNAKCNINSAEPVMHLTSGGAGSTPGLVDTDIGVRGTSNSNGTPCGQIDGAESLTLTPGAALGNRTFTGLRMDLEMTGNAVVKLTLAGGANSATYKLQTGTNITVPPQDTTPPYEITSGPSSLTALCAAASSSGPNSGSNDNCEWTVTPGFNFTSVTLTNATYGTVSLEGSGDFGNNTAFDTIFYLSNAAPTPANDTIVTNEDTAATGNVLTNDSDPDGNALTASVVSGPAHGTLSLASTGVFTYTPAANYNGPDSFTYAASDGLLSANATANITVTPVNDPPSAVNSSPSTPEDTPITITVATDIDSTSFTTTCTPPAGVVDNHNGTITFTPPLNFDGTINLSCSTTDSQGATTSSSAAVNVTSTAVNDAPVAVNDTAEINENATGNVYVPTPINVGSNDTDVDGPFPTNATNIQAVLPVGSTATANTDGTVTFTPPAGYVGPASFTYQASDGSLTSSNTATVNITVDPVICSNDTVNTSDGNVTGSFTRLTDNAPCKRYVLSASQSDGTVKFQPSGADTIDYRGFINLGPESTAPGVVHSTLRYDPDSGNPPNYRPEPWCVDPVFVGGLVVSVGEIPDARSAANPDGNTWCIANATETPAGPGFASTTFQTFGHDDPIHAH